MASSKSKLRHTSVKIGRKLWAIAHSHYNVCWWLLAASLMVSDYVEAVQTPPTDFIPSSYEPPHLGLLLICLSLTLLELGVVYVVLRPWQQRNRIMRLVLLASINVFWLFVVGLATRPRSPSPMIWHFGWLLVLELMWLVEIVCLGVLRVIQYFYRAICHL